MADQPIHLDDYRERMAQKAAYLRRLRIEVESDPAAAPMRRQELEALFATSPSLTWPEAAEKARYLIGLFADTAEAATPLRRRLVSSALKDVERLLSPPDESNEI